MDYFYSKNSLLSGYMSSLNYLDLVIDIFELQTELNLTHKYIVLMARCLLEVHIYVNQTLTHQLNMDF